MAHKQHLRLQPVARSGSFRSSAAYAELPRRRSAPGKVSSEVTEHLTLLAKMASATRDIVSDKVTIAGDQVLLFCLQEDRHDRNQGR